MEASQCSGDGDFEWAVKLNRYSLTLIGLWPKSERTTREKFLCNLRALLTFMAIGLVIVIPALHSLIIVRDDFMLMIDNLQYTLPALTSMFRIAIFWWKIEGIAPLIDMVADDWVKPKTPYERTTMIGRAQIARTLITCGYIIMGLSMIIAVIVPACGFSMRYMTNITDPGKPLLLQTHYIYDITKSPQYELTFTSQAISIFLCTLPYTGIDNFLGLLVFHICGQLEILRNRVMHLNKFANFTEVLSNSVKDHVRLFRAIIIIEDTFNFMLLLLFMYFGILFAFHGFLIISLLGDKDYMSISRLIFLITILINVFGHMSVYCAVGEILTSQCDKIHYAAYSNEWYKLNSRNARNIVLLMVKTSKSLHLTIGKMFPLTMATFSNLLKTSAGYVSILLATRN